MNKFKKYRSLIIYTIFIIVTFIIYGNSLNNDYNIDDYLVTGENATIKKGINAIPEIFTTSYKTGRDYNYGYRPITKSLFAVEYELFGKNPFVGHLINLLLYALTCIVLFNLLKKIFINYHWMFSFFIVLIFLSHPLHTEVVLSLKNREDILSFLFGIISMSLFVNYAFNKKVLSVILGFISLVIAYLSKESALVFAAIIPLTLYYFTDLKVLKSVIYFALLFVIIFVLRKYISNAIPENKESLLIENPLFAEKGIIGRFPTGMVSLLLYLKLMFFPHPLRFYYGYDMIPVVKFFSVWSLISIVVHITLLYIAIKGLKKKSIISYSIFFYLISISMFANILVPVNGIIAERLAYSASLGFSIFITYFIFFILKINLRDSKINIKRVQIAAFMLLLVFIPFSVRSNFRCPDWKDNMSLVKHDIESLENSCIANEMYATKLLFELENVDNVRSNIDVIQKHYNKCLEMYPDFYRVWNNIGFIEFVVYHNNEQAIKYFNKALEIKPNYPEALFQLGFLYEMQKDYYKSIAYYEKAAESDTTYIEALSKVANWYAKLGNYNKAIEYNKKILNANPISDIPFINLGNYFYFRSDLENSIKYWKIAIRQNPNNYQLHMNIANIYKENGDKSNSDFHFKQAQIINDQKAKEK